MGKQLIIAISAIAANGIIGKANTLPWHISEELKFFKRITAGHICIFGRKTWEHLAKKPLPNRTNIVVSTRSADKILMGYGADAICPTIAAAVLLCAKLWPEKHIFICGGAELYRNAAQYLDAAIISRLHIEADGDVIFPWAAYDHFNEPWRPIHGAIHPDFDESWYVKNVDWYTQMESTLIETTLRELIPQL